MSARHRHSTLHPWTAPRRAARNRRWSILAGGLAFLLASPLPAQDLALDVSPFPGFAESKRATAIVEAPDRRLWVAFHDSVQVHDGATVETIAIAPDGDGLRPAAIRSLAMAPDGTVWIGAERGIWRLPNGSTTAVLQPGTERLSTWQLLCTGSDLWARSTRAVHRLPARGGVDTVQLPGAGDQALLGLAATIDHLWAWSSKEVWRRSLGDGAPAWQAVAGMPPDLRHACAVDGRLVCATTTGLVEIGGDGAVEQILTMPFGGVTEVACSAATLWLANGRLILAVDRRTRTATRARLFLRGTELANLTIFALATDAQGLLWLGTDRGVFRSCPTPGIDSFVLPGIEAGDVALALAELGDGSPVLGTARGALWQQTASGWTAVPMPWSDGAGAKQLPRIEALADCAGRLAVGTSSGLWRRDGDDWRRLGEAAGIDGVTTLWADPSGLLWAAGKARVWRIATDGTVVAVPLQERAEATQPSTSSLQRDALGRLWLSTYRAGLALHHPGADRFDWVPAASPQESVLDFAPADATQPFWLVAFDGLWRIDPESGARSLLHQTARSGTLRNVLRADDGTLWLAAPRSLTHFDPRGNHCRELPSRLGAHPLGHLGHARMRRRNGELWFGAAGGYTRVQPERAVQRRCAPPLARIEALAPGVRRTLADPRSGGLDLEIRGGPLRLEAIAVDRTLDVEPTRTFVLQHLESDHVATAPDGVFAGLPLGRHRASVVVQCGDGTIETIGLGVVTVTAPPSPRPWWIAGLLGLGGFAGAGGYLGYRRRSRSTRRLTIDRVLDLTGSGPDELLDVAFLAATVADQCLQLGRARHGVVWLRAGGHEQGIRIAEFGQPSPADLTHPCQCSVAGREVRPGFWVSTEGSRRDLCLRVQDTAGISFEILLCDVARADEALLDEFEALVDRLRASLRQQSWTHRLEQDLADRQASLVADAHDLRGPLTALRLGSHDLAARLGEGDPALQTAAASVVAATERVIAAVDHLIHRQRRSAVLRLQCVDPQPLVARSVQAAALAARSKGITLQLHPAAGPCTASLDPIWFGRVLDNLLGNAVKFAPRGSTVHVRCEHDAADFFVHVDDAGPGFGADERESVFLPGVVGRAQPTAGEQQSGLGLWISRQAVQSMGGRLWVASVAPPGARVSLSLPRRPADAS
ncbi:MAG: hypothetical protein KF830_01475 [Planctomycetes bacterium]|nr:hypothetical protein [Planctomycetota bacterium]